MIHNPLNTVNEEIEREFEYIFKFKPIAKDTVGREVLDLIRSSNTRTAQAVIKAVMDIIRNGGTPVTVSTRQIDGQLYVNERQLLESIATLSDNKETK